MVIRKLSLSCNRRQLLGGGLVLLGAPHAVLLGDEFGNAALRGAGSTLVHPLMEAWVQQYRADPYQVIRRNASGGGLDDDIANDKLDYEAVGSLAGIQRIRAGFVDFATGEMPLRADYLRKSGLMQFPWVFGGVAVVANVPGVKSFTLDAKALAAIYLGRATRWSDIAIAGQNPGVTLPDAPITVLHRSDGSGSTFTFSRLLSARDDDWKRRLGSELVLQWPVGKGVNGGGEMVAAVKSIPHAIGYVGATQAKSEGLTIVGLRNGAGHSVLPEPTNIAAAVAAMVQKGEHLERLPIDSSGERAYPLVATVFGFMRAELRSARQRRTAEFIRWTLTKGSGPAHQLGYLSLPQPLAKSTLEQLASEA
ncbi:MAG TPA: phosphate ABC transporter substrate-binding protein PstS [Steroidobacteraceae bacterium]|nr:phosphate ABC transporter substrate-binding protein PstS [Steroidobacteraceae bacterium]